MKEKKNVSLKSLKIKNLNNQVFELEGSTNYIVYRGKPAILTCFKSIMSQDKIMSLKSDILEGEKKLNESYEYNRGLTEFFCNISHELRTPINIILGSIQLLQQQYFQYIDDKSKNLLVIMKQNTFRLVKLVNNLMDISKYDSGYLKLEKHNHNIVSVVEDITNSVSKFIKYKGITILFDTDTEEIIMAIDVDKIERIILNLLSNAVKFTDEGDEILVNIENKGEKVRITVKDTGIGIPEDKLQYIFNRFEQVDKTFTRTREGSGIGLSLVKTLVEKHGGSVSVKSKLGEGSEFIIDLPVTTIIEDEQSECAFTFDNKVDKIKIEFSDVNIFE